MPRYRHRRVRRRLLRPVLIALTVLLVVGFFAWLFIEPTLLTVDARTIVNPALSDDVKQLRILYVSDIHQSAWPYYTDAVNLITRINAQKPDLVLLGGDYANDPQGALTFFRSMPRIRAIYGTYAVLGECDRPYLDSELQMLKSAMVTAGVTPLVNDVEPVRIGTKNIYIAGLDDMTRGTPQLTEVAARCKADDLTILLCHNPSVIPEALAASGADGRRSWFDLGLFGHTHGDQVALFGSLLGLQRGEGSYRCGWYDPNRISLLVSDGVGTAGLPIRFLHTPKLHLITIRSK